MRNRNQVMIYVIFGLIAVGILARFARNPSALLIPVVVLGAVYLLYRYPPGAFRKKRGYRPPRSAGDPNRKKSRPKFRVIRGNKKDDEPPRYH